VSAARRALAAAAARIRTVVELRVLLGILLVSLCAWAFIAIAEEMREGETHAFDVALLLALRDPADPADPLGAPWVEELGRDVTALGGLGVLAAVTVFAAGYLALVGRTGAAALLLFSVLGGQLAVTAFKLGFDRPRPDLVPHGAATYTASFPSGHAMMAAVTWLTLAAMVARTLPRRRLRVYVLAWAVAVCLAVGVSRVYLGVHWPSDVLAGWAGGAAWAIACLLLAHGLERRGLVAEVAEDPPAPR
jgi:undecaprenyl-diphosphatase